MAGINYENVANNSDFYIKRTIYKGQLPNMHLHHSYELYFLINGEREYFIEDRIFVVAAGDLVLIPKKTLHRTAGGGGLRFLVHFTDAFLQRYFTNAMLDPLLNNLPFIFRPDPSESEWICQYFNAMLSEYTRATESGLPKNEQLICGYLYHILFTMAYGHNGYIPKNNSDNRITQIIQYISENYNHINDIEQIAKHFFVSKYHLCRFFQKKLGISLVSYLNTIKIKEACRLIKEGNLSLTEIAIECGFNSSSYFCKVFKKERGLSPTEYRKNHR